MPSPTTEHLYSLGDIVTVDRDCNLLVKGETYTVVSLSYVEEGMYGLAEYPNPIYSCIFCPKEWMIPYIEDIRARVMRKCLQNSL